MRLGLGLGLSRPSSATAASWSPADLFVGGENGGWFDPSDDATCWQDTAGTIPAGLNEAVGRIDDKSGRGN